MPPVIRMCECAVDQLMTAWTTAGSAPAWVVEALLRCRMAHVLPGLPCLRTAGAWFPRPGAVLLREALQATAWAGVCPPAADR